jgi:hypothetical protein
MKDSATIIGLLISLTAAPALAQIGDTPSFFSAEPTGYEAVISTTISGSLLGGGVSVSADHKYATVGMQATKAGTPNFTPYSIAVPAAGGFVGSAPSLGGPGSAATILDRPGMTLITPLGP